MPKIKPVSSAVMGSLQSLVIDRKITHEQRIKLAHGFRRLRFMKGRTRPPKQFQAIMGKNPPNMPTAWRHVQTIVGAVAKHRPQPKIILLDEVDIERKERGEKFLRLFDQFVERQANRAIHWKWIDNIIADGMGVKKWTRHPWKSFPDQRDNESEEEYLNRVGKFFYTKPLVPLRVRTVDPLTVFFPTNEWEPQDVLELSYRSLRDSLIQLRIAPRSGSLSSLRLLEAGEPYPRDEIPNIPHGSMEVTEFWTENTVYYGIAGQWFEMENPYSGIIPYEITWGYPTGSSDPALEFVSALYPFMKLGPWGDMMVAALVGWAMTATNPILTTWRDPIPNSLASEQETAITEIPWGKNVDLGIGGRAQFISPPDIGTSMKEGIETILSLQDRSALAPVVSGFLGTRTAGLAINSAVENAISFLEPVIDNIQIGQSNYYKKTLDFVSKVIKAPVYVSGFDFIEGGGTRKIESLIKWEPKDTNKVLDVLCDLKKDTLQDEITKGQHAAFMMEKGIFSKDRAMEWGGVEDVAAENRKMLKDAVRANPIVQQYLAQAAVQDEPPLAAMLEQAMSAQGGAMEGAPEGAPVEEPMMEEVGGGQGGMTPEGMPAGLRGGKTAGAPSVVPRGPNRVNPTPVRR